MAIHEGGVSFEAERLPTVLHPGDQAQQVGSEDRLISEVF